MEAAYFYEVWRGNSKFRLEARISDRGERIVKEQEEKQGNEEHGAESRTAPGGSIRGGRDAYRTRLRLASLRSDRWPTAGERHQRGEPGATEDEDNNEEAEIRRRNAPRGESTFFNKFPKKGGDVRSRKTPHKSRGRRAPSNSENAAESKGIQVHR
ncbi:uncharacterized protein [Drosophila takahashii]|uniref:uncharacterized protein n=1 Tax=Drosophila takahashii TaxID=29030 RepID=UPI00389925B0